MTPPKSRLSRAHIALIAVCVLHALSPLILRGLHSGLGWDETVYISQIDPHVPAGVFSAPRARGLTLLTAPASIASGSIAVLRVWMALLSGIGLYLAFLPWLRLRRGAVVPVAAALWSSIWVCIYYGFEAMPNQYVAYGAVSAVGWLLLALRDPSRRRYFAYLALALGFTALVRPTDAMFVLLGLAGSTLVIRGLSRRLRILAIVVMAAGWAAGVAEWIAEAYVRFGSPLNRFHMASTQNTGGLHFSLGDQLRALAGPLLCRAGCTANAPTVTRLWWFALVPLVGLGIYAARRQHRLTMHAVALVAALALAAEYILGIGYAAPRFLEPTYALLALPIAEGVVWAAGKVAPSKRPLAIAGLGLVLAAQLAVQGAIVVHLNRKVTIDTERNQNIATALNAVGVRGDCRVRGIDDAPIAFLAGCTDTARPLANQLSQTVQPHQAMAIIGEHPPAEPTFYTDWPMFQIRGVHIGDRWRVWIMRRNSSS